MAENSGNPAKEAGNNTEELNDLLQSALDDFDSCPVPSAAPATSAKIENKQPGKNLKEDFEKKFKSLFMTDVDEATFSNQMSNLLNEAKNEIQTSSNVSNSAPVTDDNTDTVSSAISSLVENIEQIKDSMKNEQLPDSFSMGGPFMEHMFQMLMSKEVLYPSLLSVKEKYPSWLEENKDNIDSEELSRYTQQFNIIKRICMIFESENDSDSEEIKHKRFTELVSLLQEMTDLGQPPEDLAESVPNMGSELLGGDMDPNSCNPM